MGGGREGNLQVLTGQLAWIHSGEKKSVRDLVLNKVEGSDQYPRLFPDLHIHGERVDLTEHAADTMWPVSKHFHNVILNTMT